MATAVMERPHVLHSAMEYNAAMEALDQLLDRNPKKGTREFELLELLSLLVEDYESRKIPEPPAPAPAAVVEFMLGQKGLTRADLIEPLGGKSRVSEFLAGKRPLSTNQIKALRELLGVSADLLIESAATATGSGRKTALAPMQLSPWRTSFVRGNAVAPKRKAKANPATRSRKIARKK